MNANNPQWQRQQELQRQRQQQGWWAEQEKKRKINERQAKMSGGINISGVDKMDARDIVGRDQFNEVQATYPREERSGFSLFMLRVYTFLWTLFGYGVVYIIIGSLIFGTMSNGQSEDMSTIVIGAGVLAVISAYLAAASVSRYKD